MRSARIAGVIAGGVLALSAFALAASADAINLTEEQTLALYGSEFQASFRGHYSDTSGLSARTVTFHYAGKLSDYGYMDNGGGFTGASMNYISDPKPPTRMRGIVYTASSSDWGGGDFPTANSCTWNKGLNEDFVNCSLQLSVPIAGYDEFEQWVAWSSGDWTYYNPSGNGYYANSNRAYKNSSGFLCYNVNGGIRTLITQGNAQGGLTFSGVPYCGYVSMPTYAYSASVAPLDESRLTQFCFSRVFATTATTGLPLNEVDLRMQVVQQSTKLGTSDPPQGDLWIILGCPYIRDYVPATTVATTTQTTRLTGGTGLTGIGTTQTGVDMSQISVDLREIIYNQRWQIQQNEVLNENARIIANNTNTIVLQLNKIYAEMIKSGELPVTTDNSMIAAIGSAIEGYTTARIPEEPVQNIGFWVALVDFIMSRYQLLEIAAFSVCAGVTGWILFRGRTS